MTLHAVGERHENEAGKIDFGTASPVGDVHTLFCRIYTPNAIAYPRTETTLHSLPGHPSGGIKTHTIDLRLR